MARAVHRRSKSSPKLGLARSLSRVRVRSPSLLHKSASNSIERDQRIEFLSESSDDDGIFGGGYNKVEGGCNKVMIVVDPTIEAKGALEWALSHALQTQDTIVLLHVAKPSKKGKKERNGKQKLRATELLLHSMKNMCQMKRPGVRVEVEMVEGKEKGPVIVEQARQKEVTLVVLGQRKKSMMWRLMKRLSIRRRRRSSGGGAVEYCIQNAPCMAIAVRRKSNKLGGYLITTKRHKKFWLLA